MSEERTERSQTGTILDRLRRRARRGPDGQSPVRLHRGDFRFNTLSVLVLLVLFGAGVAAATVFTGIPEENLVALAAAGVFLSAGILYAAPYWAVVVVLIGAAWGVLPGLLSAELAPVAAGITVGLLISPSVEIIREWDKIVVLRLGRFHRVRGPGPVVLLPLLDSVAGYVDTRIRVSDFSAEKSLTADTVPVHVDALAFWMIWDAGKAILEVEHFAEAVVLSAQTALRASIGANDLATLLSERERLGQEIREIVDAKTNPWGITILSVEFKEILIPHELEDVLSREAQASREHSARVILSRSEAEIAESYARAADTYRNDPVALQIRAMNMIYEGIRAKGGLVMVPSDALKGMNLGTVLGAGAYNNDVTDSGGGSTTE